MQTVHKAFVLIDILTDVIEVRMPKDGKVLSVGNQYETLCIWYETDTETHEKIVPTRSFRVAGTGHPLTEGVYPKVKLGRFLGTVLFKNGVLVFHIYETKES